MSRPLLCEVCVEGVDGLIAAQDSGADRIELCASLIEGGITPSRGTIRGAVAVARVPVHVMVRPRGGDFLYSAAEFDSMRDDVAAVRELGAAGVVFGCLLPDGRIDEERMRALTEAAGPLAVTCHRAFDMVRDPRQALEALVRSGVGRVLTSGLCDTGTEGAPLLAELVRQAGERITVLGCGGLDSGNIARFVSETGVREVHFAALSDDSSPMEWRNPRIGMGGTALDREYRLTTTDPHAVAATIRAAKGL